MLIAGSIFMIFGIRKNNLCMKSLLFFALIFNIFLSLAMILPNYKFSFGSILEFNISSTSKPVDYIGAIEAIAAIHFCNGSCPCNFTESFASPANINSDGPTKF